MNPLRIFAAPQQTLPSLDRGDRLSRKVFGRPYAQCFYINKAELIDAIV
ncbi:hypothetical protein [uncultured Thermosynechococcus sp.]|nr:hypothetical protein [uncultured Thermosynechococcus sp.]